jgi:hypothetical protein
MKNLPIQEATNVPMVPSSPSPIVESEITQPKAASQIPTGVYSSREPSISPQPQTRETHYSSLCPMFHH